MEEFDFNQYCNDAFFQYFSKLKDNSLYTLSIKEALERTETGSHGIYEDVLCPYILDIIESNDRFFQKDIDHVFNLIEELITHECFEVRCVAEVSFIERFVHDLKPRRDVEKYLKPASLQAARNVAVERYGINPYTWEVER